MGGGEERMTSCNCTVEEIVVRLRLSRSIKITRHMVKEMDEEIWCGLVSMRMKLCESGCRERAVNWWHYLIICGRIARRFLARDTP